MFSEPVSTEKIFHTWYEKLKIKVPILSKLFKKQREAVLFMSEAEKDAKRLLNFWLPMV